VVINDARHAFEPEYLQRVVPYFFELKKVRRREGGREGGREGRKARHISVCHLSSFHPKTNLTHYSTFFFFFFFFFFF